MTPGNRKVLIADDSETIRFFGGNQPEAGQTPASSGNKPGGTVSMILTEIPTLAMDDSRIEPNGMPVIVIWGDREISRFFTLRAAKAAVLMEYRIQRTSRAEGARLFAWDGQAWEQTFC